MSRKVMQVMFLANQLGACSLNGQPARLEIRQRKLPRVITQDGAHSACFNPSTVERVVIEKGGRFFTR